MAQDMLWILGCKDKQEDKFLSAAACFALFELLSRSGAATKEAPPHRTSYDRLP